MKKVANLVGFQLAWLACILGAAGGRPVLGVIVTALFLAAHLALASSNRAAEGALIVLAGVIGYTLDSLLVLGGWLVFDTPARLGGPSPLWMVALWMAFAATLLHSLGWLQRRYGLGAVLGAVGGPAAYWAGNRLGAVDLPQPVEGLVAVGLVWMVAMPALIGAALVATSGRFGPARPPVTR